MISDNSIIEFNTEFESIRYIDLWYTVSDQYELIYFIMKESLRDFIPDDKLSLMTSEPIDLKITIVDNDNILPDDIVGTPLYLIIYEDRVNIYIDKSDKARYQEIVNSIYGFDILLNSIIKVIKNTLETLDIINSSLMKYGRAAREFSSSLFNY